VSIIESFCFEPVTGGRAGTGGSAWTISSARLSLAPASTLPVAEMIRLRR